MFDLKGKIAVVTGAASGIGREAAACLAKQGAKVMLSDINEQSLREFCEILRQQGSEVDWLAVDITVTNQLKELMNRTNSVFGGIDILVNSAGILGTAPIEEIDKETEWNRVLDADLSGTFFASQSALPYLKKSKAGRIINIASLTGRNGGFAGSCSYAAAKGGVIAATRNMARSMAVSGYPITVNVVCPGPVWTSIQAGYSKEKQELQLKNVPMKRFGTAHEVAAAVCYLASDEAAFITGASLDINGGAYMG